MKKDLLSQLKKAKEENFKNNLKFIDLYVAFMMKKSNKEWSKAQKKFVDMFYNSAR